MKDGTYLVGTDRSLTKLEKTTGYWVAIQETSLEEAEPNTNIGVWTDPETKRVWVDQSVWVGNLITALILGRTFDQLAIWDCANNEAIEVPAQ